MRHIGTFAIAIAALLSGCRHAPLAYHLVPQGSSALLIPPTQTAGANVNAPSFDLTIKNARHTPRSTGSCDIKDDLVTLHWEANTANVKLQSESYVVPPEAGVAAQTAPRFFFDSLQSLEKFRNDLENLETNGCLRPGESRRLKVTLSERLPLPSEAGFRFRFGSFELTGIFDLAPDFRLHTTGPVYADTVNDSARPVVGFETVDYIFTGRQTDYRTKVSLASVTETDLGKEAVTKSKPQNTLSFAESYGYFRIVLRTEAAASEHLSVGTLLSAPEESTLAEATRQLGSAPADSCDAVTAHSANCITFPPKVGVGIDLRVQVNGREVFVGIGGSLGAAIRGNKPSADIEKTLRVRRLYQGRLIPVKFDPASPAIFGLVLMPGDEITW